ncbi:MAG: molybdopterin-dependent oxidoreductase, partial [Syntrophales bacterium]|nr:molybdopterin-dependent oxidoreductase [Syntrophales bacterium]
GIVDCLAALEEHPLWRDRGQWKQGAGPFKKRGIGVSAVFNAMGYGRGLPDSAIAKIELTQEGRIRVYNGVSDMGQGNATAFVQIAGQILCQEDTRIELVQPDTERTLPSGSSSASRTTYTYGNALIKASHALRKKVIGRASLILMADKLDHLELLPGRVRDLESGREISLEMIASMMAAEDRLCISQFLMPVARDKLDTGKEFFIGFPHLIFSYAAHLAAIEVDELTGAVEVKEYASATEAGHVLNPQTFTQQVQGAIAQGIGYALYEEIVTDKGRLLTPDFTTYHIPGSMDVPRIDSRIVETWETSGPYGMKGVGEVGANGPLPAIANALADACGIHMTRSPFSPERVLQALSEKQSREKGRRP